MENLAEKLIDDHKHPMVRVKLPITSKALLKSEGENLDVENCLQTLGKVLKHDRVERRNIRALGKWKANGNLVEVVKSTRSANNFGFKNKAGHFLYPEEALFLQETNRLELLHGQSSLSLQEGYNLLIPDLLFNKYLVYKKLVLDGYKLIRHEEIIRRLNKTNFTNEEKPDLGSPRKKIKVEESFVEKLLEKARKIGPQTTSQGSQEKLPDYFVFLPNNSSKTNCDLKLYICDGNLPEMENYNSETKHLFALCLDNNVAFYKFRRFNERNLLLD